jgi:hypothetical protein
MKNAAKQQGNTKSPQHGAQFLWNSVILQAIDDATHWISVERNSYDRLNADRERAREWLTTPSDDFDTVCNLAGLEPSRVRIYAAALIGKAVANPPKSRRCKNVKGSKPGEGENFTEGQRDRLTPVTREIAKIDFSQNRDSAPCR